MCCLHDLGTVVQQDYFLHSEVFDCSQIFSSKAKVLQVKVRCSKYLVGLSDIRLLRAISFVQTNRTGLTAQR